MAPAHSFFHSCLIPACSEQEPDPALTLICKHLPDPMHAHGRVMHIQVGLSVQQVKKKSWKPEKRGVGPLRGEGEGKHGYAHTVH